MRTVLPLAASAALLALTAITPTQVQAGYSCHACTMLIQTIVGSGGGHTVPNPTRRGDYIGHFDANGIPQSIVTPADNHIEESEVPCPPRMKYSYGS